MGEEPDHRIDELEDQMQAASSLINSFEEEVESLRRDLEEASLALRVARQEVSARGQALEEKDLALDRAEQQTQTLREAITGLKIQNSDEQLQLRNQHIAELARMQDKFGAQRISGIEKALRKETSLKDEYERDLQDLEQRRSREIEALEDSYKEWRDSLLENVRELKSRHAAEIQGVWQDAESQKKELQQTLREDYDRRREETRRSLEARYEEEFRALRESSEEREHELRSKHQTEMEALQGQTRKDLREAEEKRQNELREIKTVAENRERGLRRGHSAKSKEASDEAERRLTSLQAQRKADNEALRFRYENELDLLRREHDERLAAEVDRWRQEVMTLEEKLESSKLERAAEARAYINRLKELKLEGLGTEALEPEERVAASSSRDGHVNSEPSGLTAEEKAPDAGPLRRRIAELEGELEYSQTTMEQLTAELERRWAEEDHRDASKSEVPDFKPQRSEQPETVGNSTKASEFSAPGTTEDDTRVRELEVKLGEVWEDRRQYAEELGKALDKLRRLSDPEHRLRSGIAAFNESNHSRNVASISKALGLPGVHAGVYAGMYTDAESDVPGKPTFTFVWKGISWRRYVAEPIEGLEEPRVYLVATGDDPEESPPPPQEPNARIDARGSLVLGVQAR